MFFEYFLVFHVKTAGQILMKIDTVIHRGLKAQVITKRRPDNNCGAKQV